MSTDALKEMMEVLKRVDELRFLAVEKLRYEEASFWRDTREFFNEWLDELMASID